MYFCHTVFSSSQAKTWNFDNRANLNFIPIVECICTNSTAKARPRRVLNSNFVFVYVILHHLRVAPAIPNSFVLENSSDVGFLRLGWLLCVVLSSDGHILSCFLFVYETHHRPTPCHTIPHHRRVASSSGCV